MIEQTAELDRMTEARAELLMKRRQFLETVLTNTSCHSDQETLDSLLLSYETAVSQASTSGLDVVSQEFTINWDYLQSVFFATTILTTIGTLLTDYLLNTDMHFLGYGNIAPVTFYGRLFCLLFGIIGIPFTLSVVADVGGILATLVSKLWDTRGHRLRRAAERLARRRSAREEEEEDLFDSNLTTAFLALFILFLFLSFGAWIFSLFEDQGGIFSKKKVRRWHYDHKISFFCKIFTPTEDWSFLDSFYFCFITMTTIGFGDLVPGLGADRETYMLMCTVYIFIGMALTTTIIELVRRQYAESWQRMIELRAQIQAGLNCFA